MEGSLVSGGYITGVNGGPSLQQCFSQIGASDVALSSGANSAGAGFVFGTEGSSALANLRSGPAANLSRMFGNVGNFVGGMGMGVAPQAPMIGAGVAIGFVCGGANPPPPATFGPNVFANQGANAAAPAGGGMSVDASGDKDKAEEKNQITDAVREAARKQIQGKGGGYSDEDITAILKRAEEASGNDRRKFEEIIRALPQRPAKFEDQKQGDKVVVSADQQRQKWVREFGDWQARYLEKIDSNDNKSAARDNVVSEFAAEGAPSYTLRRKPDAASKGVGYEVTSAQGKTEVNTGARVYFNPQNKHWYKDAAMTQELSLPGTADATAKPESISVGGGGSYMNVVPAGSVPAPKTRSTTDESHRIFDRFEVQGEPVGAAAQNDYNKIPVVDGKRYVYVNRENGDCFYRDRAGVSQPFSQPPTYRNGRLYMGSSDAVNPEKANNVVTFMDGLHQVAQKYATRSTATGPLENEQKQKRTEQVWNEFVATAGNDATVKGLTHAYDPQTGVLNITCPPDKVLAVQSAMKANVAATAARGDRVLADLPEGTKISVNGGQPFTPTAGCYKRVSDEVKNPMPVTSEVTGEGANRALHVKGDVDLSALPSKEAVQARLSEIIKQNQQAGQSLPMVFDGTIKMPSFMSHEDVLAVAGNLKAANGGQKVTLEKVHLGDESSRHVGKYTTERTEYVAVSGDPAIYQGGSANSKIYTANTSTPAFDYEQKANRDLAHSALLQAKSEFSFAQASGDSTRLATATQNLRAAIAQAKLAKLRATDQNEKATLQKDIDAGNAALRAYDDGQNRAVSRPAPGSRSKNAEDVVVTGT